MLNVFVPSRRTAARLLWTPPGRRTGSTPSSSSFSPAGRGHIPRVLLGHLLLLSALAPDRGGRSSKSWPHSRAPPTGWAYWACSETRECSCLRKRGDVQTEPWVLSARLTFLSGCVRRTVSSSAAQPPETQFDLLIISVIIYNHWVRMCLSHMLHQSMISTAVSRRDEPADGQTDLPTTTTTYNIHNIRSNIIISN